MLWLQHVHFQVPAYGTHFMFINIPPAQRMHFLHKAHLANLVLQDCAVKTNKLKLLICFHVLTLVFEGRQSDSQAAHVDCDSTVRGFRLSAAE
jgi:hypothetical protein